MFDCHVNQSRSPVVTDVRGVRDLDPMITATHVGFVVDHVSCLRFSDRAVGVAGPAVDDVDLLVWPVAKIAEEVFLLEVCPRPLVEVAGLPSYDFWTA